MADAIVVIGAREHNLRNITVEIPRHQLVVITGLSGSGKSSLAFDTIYAEGQRRYVESLSAYARQFLEQMEKPDVDSIDGLSPAIAIEQKSTSRNPRSTVGTVTEIYDYLRLLFARLGTPHCWQCGQPIATQTVSQIVDRVLALPERTRVYILAPIARGKKGEFRKELAELRKAGFVRVRIDGELRDLADDITLAKTHKHTIEVVVDRLILRPGIESRLADSLGVAFTHGDDVVSVAVLGDEGEQPVQETIYSQRFACSTCGVSMPELTPRLFSFNSPHGACSTCSGLGTTNYFDPDLIVPDPSKSLADGAVVPWESQNTRNDMLGGLAKHLKFKLETPWKDLPKKVRDVILHGTGDEEIGFVLERGSKRYEFRRPFEGVVTNLERRWKETDSDWVREELGKYMSVRLCRSCQGARLKPEALAVRLHGRTITEVCGLSIGAAHEFVTTLALTPQEAAIGERLLREARERLGFLHDVGLDYLTLERHAATLSGGEAQRIRLATQIGASLSGVLYVLDEPSIGLHPRDNERLIAILRQLRDQGNTVIVVEHDADMIRVADVVVDLGLGAGEQGGRVIYAGPVEGLLSDPRSLTAKYLRDDAAIPVPAVRRRHSPQRIRVTGATAHNLAGVDVEIPLGILTCVTGVSGSGKSTLVHDVIYAALKRAKGDWDRPVGAHETLEGAEYVTDVVLVDQQPIGRSPRSNPVTYLKAFDPIRELFASTKEARTRGLTASHFSFNVPGGRCEACEGEGVVRVEMQFLADVFVPCDQCEGKRFRPQVLEVHYKGKDIDQVLALTVHEALAFFAGAAKVTRRLQVLEDIGLGYLRLGQPATTLSGGEAQRIKIAAHLVSQGGERMLYVLDEPTTGLHFDDIVKLLTAFKKLLQAGHSLLVIEHNLDVIKTADWIIDLGPDGGAAGGRMVAVGTPEQIAAVEASATGRYLARVLAASSDRAYADQS